MTRRRVLVAATSLMLAPAAFNALRVLRDADGQRDVEAPPARATLRSHALPVPSRVPLAGDAVMLESSGGKQVALAAAGGADVPYEEVVALHRALTSSGGGANGAVASTVSRSILFVPNGTQATVVDEGVLLYQVRIDEGEHAGRRVYVERERAVKARGAEGTAPAGGSAGDG